MKKGIRVAECSHSEGVKPKIQERKLNGVIFIIFRWCTYISYIMNNTVLHTTTRWFKYDRDKLTCLHTVSPGHI